MRLLTAALLFLLPLPAAAFDYCRCAYDWTPAEAWERSGSVFVGKVNHIRDLGTKKLRVNFEVEKSWRGPQSPELRLFTDRADSFGFLKYGITCGFPFEEGKTYLVYAFYEKQSPLTVDQCTRTRPIEQAAEDLAVLGEPDVTFTPSGPVYRKGPDGKSSQEAPDASPRRF